MQTQDLTYKVSRNLVYFLGEWWHTYTCHRCYKKFTLRCKPPIFYPPELLSDLPSYICPEISYAECPFCHEPFIFDDDVIKAGIFEKDAILLAAKYIRRINFIIYLNYLKEEI